MRGKLVLVAATLSVGLGGSLGSASAQTADEKMKANLRNLATMEETYFVDHMHYGTAKQLRADGWHLRVPSGQVIFIHLNDDSWNYCLAGRVARHRWWIYASDKGGIYGPRRHDVCDSGAYPHAAGRFPAG